MQQDTVVKIIHPDSADELIAKLLLEDGKELFPVFAWGNPMLDTSNLTIINLPKGTQKVIIEFFPDDLAIIKCHMGQSWYRIYKLIRYKNNIVGPHENFIVNERLEFSV